MPFIRIRRTFVSAVLVRGTTPASHWSRAGEVCKQFWKHSYRQAVPWLVIFTGLVFFAECSGGLDSLSMKGLDSLMIWRQPKMSEKILIIEITEDDYRTSFQSSSPLLPDPIINLIKTVLQGHPSVIGVDLDTSGEKWCKAAPLVQEAVNPNVPMIFAEAPDGVREPLGLGPVLGGALKDPDNLGIPRFPLDPDGAVRRYENHFTVVGTLESRPPCMNSFSTKQEKATSDRTPAKQGTLLSFSRAIVENYPHRDAEISDKPTIFNFYGDRYRFQINDARDFLPDPPGASKPRELSESQLCLLEGKIVLIGGNYPTARDRYFTPLGQMAGVELVAYAIQSDLDGGGIRAVNWAVAAFIEIVAGSFVVFFYFYFRRSPRSAFWWSLVFVPLAALVGSLVSFHAGAYWLNFVPVIAGMLIHQMYELSKKAQESQAEAGSLRSELNQSKRAVEELKAALEELHLKELADKEAEIEWLRNRVKELERPRARGHHP